ncbi:MAG: TlpA family protein disulfide reductase [Gammaproteobacteria bacterium]|nr:TlpA family protein disulfide reductase [Gammaproteobacteria bacterium]
MTTKKIVLVLALLSAIHLGLYIVVRQLDNPLTHAPNVEFTFLGGTKKNMADFNSGPTLVVFWATSCKTCVAEVPHLIELYREMHSQGLEIIGVAMPYDPPANVLTYAERMSIPYPISLDIDASVTHAFDQVDVTPTTFLVSAAGRIEMHHFGKLDMKKLRQQIAGLITQKIDN